MYHSMLILLGKARLEGDVEESEVIEDEGDRVR